MIWDWQQIQDYERRREALRQWLAQKGRDKEIFKDDDVIMQEVRDRLMGNESE